jgi:hypothetical protein
MNNILRLYRELYRRSPVLAIAGWVHFGLLVITLSLSLWDTRVVTGINAWIKPSKFAVSIGLYLWTIGWLSIHLRISERLQRTFAWSIALVMTAEMSLIFMQAARGVPSHFNTTTAFDAAVFSVMGLLIFLNTMIVLMLMLLFWFRPATVSAPYLWGIRLGMFLFFLSSLQGSTMIVNRGHTIAMEDGGPGLPLLNWSVKAGDLRVPHFLGLHSLQIFPLLGHLLSRQERLKKATYVILAAAVYFALLLYLLWQAFHGKPLIGL